MSARVSPSISNLSTLGALATALAVVLSSCTSCTERPGTPAPAPTAAPPQAKPPAPQEASRPPEAASSPKPAASGWPSPLTDPTAAKAWAEIQALYTTIPTTFKGFKGDMDELAARVRTCSGRLETFLSMYPRTDQACQGRVMLAKLRYYLRLRHKRDLSTTRQLPADEVERRMREYNDAIVKLAMEALDCLSADQPSWRADALKAAADSEYRSKNFDAALPHYRKLLADHPKFPDRNNVLTGIGNCLLELKRHAEGVEFVRKTIEENPKSGYLPFYYQLLWKLHLASGNWGELVSICDEIETVGRKRLGDKGIDARERQAWIRYRGFGAFRRGYAILMDGRPGDALDAFNQGLELMNEIKSELAEQGKSFPPELEVYWQRIVTMINYTTQRHGDVPASDLGTVHWATGNRVALGESLGKAVLVVIRAYGDKRQQEFLKALDAHVAEHPDKLRMVSLSYMQGTTRSTADQAQEALAEAMDLGLRSCAVGIDPSRRSEVIRGFGATVGSGNAVIVGPDGTDQFFMQDPRQIDSGFVIKVLDRIAQVTP